MSDLVSLVSQLKVDKIKPNTAIGQHFLIDSDIADRLINASNIDRDDVVIEVGAGTGIVTRLVAE